LKGEKVSMPGPEGLDSLSRPPTKKNCMDERGFKGALFGMKERWWFFQNGRRRGGSLSNKPREENPPGGIRESKDS